MLFSKGHPACHQQGPHVALIGSMSLDQSFGPMMCSLLALAQQPARPSLKITFGSTEKMPRYKCITTPRSPMYLLVLLT
ncbi:hypothetical protein V8C26DRAFT_406264 [Trichoderma gracile]